MSKSEIPTYLIDRLFNSEEEVLKDYFFIDGIDNPKMIYNRPYRTNYYGIEICLNGSIELKANLESYVVTENNLVVLSPQIIKEWNNKSDDFEAIIFLFTSEFLLSNNILNLDEFSFFDVDSTYCLNLDKEQKQLILSSLNSIKERHKKSHFYKKEILKNLINILLYDIATIYDRRRIIYNPVQTRSQLLTADFKKLVQKNFHINRNVKFYADNLNVTPKHLTEIVKEITGKTAKAWIDENVLLEAKFLLQNPNLTISQITDMLHFSDQSIFGKFFKNLSGISPNSYRHTL